MDIETDDELTTWSELLHPRFSPVHRLSDGAAAAVTVQVTGPPNTAIAQPHALVHAARQMGLERVVDATRLAAAQAVRSTAADLPLLVTIDLFSPGVATSDTSAEAAAVSVRPQDLLHRPHRTIAAVQAARRAGRSVWVDGLGIDDAAMTLLALIEPDVVVVDRQVMQIGSSPRLGTFVHALSAHVQETSTVVIADGVDSARHLQVAQTLGATHGMGEAFPAVDHPGMVVGPRVPMSIGTRAQGDPTEPTTPYTICAGSHRARTGSKRLLIEMSKALEAQAAASGGAVVVLGTFQHARHFTVATSLRWDRLAQTTALAGVYGVGVRSMTDGAVVHAALDPDDPLADEWNVAVLAPHFSALLAARDRHDGADDLDRTFDFVQTYDRATVTRAIHAILDRFSAA
ncbi:EAL domain-containing protein [uncultured Williamsia sp.]|uniref:EAL domain-containing protein n=1 Tax=uncultured Williamsia sp. TaxID=259311 RepID=UPI00263187F0|nr:EAL domain-containing protein [uncultured Williamsia sp.]